nr:ribbon-helix-helix domain-containing protein [Pseudomonas sp. GX19020]
MTEIGPGDGMTVAQLITRLWHEAVDVDHDLGNFTSFLRICCNRYHALIAAGEISAEHSVAIASHPAREILARETACRNLRMNGYGIPVTSKKQRASCRRRRGISGPFGIAKVRRSRKVTD